VLAVLGAAGLVLLVVAGSAQLLVQPIQAVVAVAETGKVEQRQQAVQAS
jgi:hypothetical protein